MIIQADKQISKWIYDRVHASPVLTFLSVIGAKYMIYVLGFLLLIITPDVLPITPTVTVWRVVEIAVAVGFVWFVTCLIQLAVRRKRPSQCQIYEAKIPLMCKTPSFPSAHASISFAVAMLSVSVWYYWAYTSVFWGVALGGAGLFFLMAVWVALSRVAVGVHYVSDVIVGAILGSAISFVWVYIALTHLG